MPFPPEICALTSYTIVTGAPSPHLAFCCGNFVKFSDIESSHAQDAIEQERPVSDRARRGTPYHFPWGTGPAFGSRSLFGRGGVRRRASHLGVRSLAPPIGAGVCSHTGRHAH